MNINRQPRRKFLQSGITGLMLAFFGSLPKFSFAKSIDDRKKGFVVQQDEGMHILTGRRKVPMTIKISRSNNDVENISFCTEDIIPGRKLRIHKHLYHDELIFIQKGEGIITLDQDIIAVKTGAVVYIPRGVWHGLENSGTENMVMVFQYTPAGFEQYFIENGTVVGMPEKSRTREEYALAEKKYGMVYKENQ